MNESKNPTPPHLRRVPFRNRLADTLATILITVGGIGTILMLLAVVLVLVVNALPLARSTRIKPWRTLAMPTYLESGIDEHGTVLWGLTKEGDIEVRDLQTKQLLATHERDLHRDAQISSVFLAQDQNYLALGLSNGAVLRVKVEFKDELVPRSELPKQVALSKSDPVVPFGESLYQWFDQSTVREIRLKHPKWLQVFEHSAAIPIQLVDYVSDTFSRDVTGSAESHVLALAGRQLILRSSDPEEKGEVQYSGNLQVRGEGSPACIMLNDTADQVLVAWAQGVVDRYRIEDSAKTLSIVESQSSFLSHDAVVCSSPLVGRQSLACGTERGKLLIWTITTSEGAGSTDNKTLRLSHQMQVSDHPLATLSSSNPGRVVTVMDEKHRVYLCHSTTQRTLAKSEPHVVEGFESLPSGALDTRFARLNEKQGVLLAVSFDRVSLANVDIGFPQASYEGFVRPQWYEGMHQPAYVWQSTSSQSSEPKLSLVPLFWGSLKAAFFALIFSLPLGLGAAIYTSEFASPLIRQRIKPVLELIASFPSVVVGFIAAYVLASVLSNYLLTIWFFAVGIPFGLILCSSWFHSYKGTLLKYRNNEEQLRLMCFSTSVMVMAVLAWLFGYAAESLFFGGSLVSWYGELPDGSPLGWMLVLVPAGEVVLFLVARGSVFRPARLIMLGLLLIVLTSAASWVLSLVGLDIRATLVDGYREHNSLLLALALGFCIIPVIYTLCDDALRSVPRQLRNASYACGASRWQTAKSIVFPAAASGLISAALIAFARAAGETILVLTTVSNTPLMELNPFTGLKTITSVLVIELPETTQGETHYRTLFLAALLLFGFTLALNSLAEFLRVRYRRGRGA